MDIAIPTWPAFSPRIERLAKRARTFTRRITGDIKIPEQAPDGRTPFLDAFERHPGEPYGICLAEAIVESWLVSEPQMHPDDHLLGAPRPPRLLVEHFSWGITVHREVLDAPAYAPRREQTLDRLELLSPRLFPASMQEVQAEGIRRLGSPEAWQASKNSLWWVAGYQGHTVPDFHRLLTIGIDGVLADIRHHRRRSEGPAANDVLTACEIIYSGLARWLVRQAEAAETCASGLTDEAQRADLIAAARTCRAVAGPPPRSLRGACQLLWAYALWDDVDSLGRIDQYLNPFHVHDATLGQLGPGQAVETMAALWINLMRWSAHTLTVGGQDADGGDATTDLTWLCLELNRRLHDTHPRIALRLHDGSPPGLLAAAVDMWSEGLADPSLVSDAAVVPAMVAQGITLADARGYTVQGCQELEVPGKSNTGSEDGSFNLAKCMELALNDGRCRISGAQIGPKTGDPPSFASFAAVWRAYCTQVEVLTGHFVALNAIGVRLRSANLAKLVRMPLTADCLARGLDPDGGGAHYGPGMAETLGIAAAADQLTAIRTVVFDEGRMSMPKLIDLLDRDFAGGEGKRLLLDRAPKFGNDHAVADATARDVASHFWATVNGYVSARGGRYVGASSLLSSGVFWGMKVGAGADGRRCGAPLGNTCGPRTGADRSGVTAMLNSVARLPFALATGGATCNARIPSSMLRSTADRERAAALVRGFFVQGGQMIQVTPVDAATLRAAKADPERHQDVMVRIGGYSARFVNLSPAEQDELIARGDGW